MAPFNHLPSEIVTLIVDYINEQDLHSCTLTNKQLYTATNPLLWRSPDVKKIDRARKFIHSLHLAKHLVGKYIRSVNLWGFAWTDFYLSLLMKHAHLLEELVIQNGNNITDASFYDLPRFCPNITQLHLYQLSSITQQSINAVGQYCHYLRTLTLSDCHQLGADTFSALADCPLEDLTIGQLPPELMLQQTEKVVADLARFHYLTRLQLYSAPRYFIQHLLLCRSTGDTCWPRLVKLAIYGYIHNGDGATGSALIAFLQAHPDLKHLELIRGFFSDTLLNGISDIRHPNLIDLNLSDNRFLSSYSVRQLVRCCPQLRYVSLDSCGLKANGFPEVGENCIDTMHEDHLDEHKELCLVHLDQEAIDKIRLGS